ncbi:hypothetical protein RvY_06636 [Ramazzottius varieornatus]|uniref:CID domain-containing protein n=1 Tax=Ramazzottius varieornatus TaxID=947166 RepID=A0A1D1V8U4_RAMVA|nr:hypothetical protein RvY_06636 [Ramazzottius varieornatus]
MAAFSDQAFKTRLKDLNQTQQSIQTISLWAIHHRKHCNRVVAIWMDQLREAKDAAQKLTLLYFANDVIQNMRKKGTEYQSDFKAVMLEAFDNAATAARLTSNDKIIKSLGRLVVVWRERSIFDEAFLTKLEQGLETIPAAEAAPQKTAASLAATSATRSFTVPPVSPSVTPKTPTMDNGGESMPKRLKINSADFQAFSGKSKPEAAKTAHVPTSDDEEYEEVPFVNGETQAPKLETLLRLVQKLQSAPSANAAIRSKIAELPAVITDPAAIDRISDRQEIDRLIGVAKEGLQMVVEYNKELNQELLDRQAVASELARQLAYHRKIIDDKERLREDLANQISQRRAFRDKLAIHVDSLPDMTGTSSFGNSYSRSPKSSTNKNGSAK